MDRIPQTPPPIDGLAGQANRPRWSVMIPAYNCSEFLKEALGSVLVQDPGAGQMQIEVVDDASTDADVKALVQELGQGRVDYYRQAVNVGSLRNFETCLNRSRGELVHLLHGDDRVLPGFYAKISELFKRFPQAGAAFCNCYNIRKGGLELTAQPQEMEQDGILVDWLDKIAQNQRLQYVSMVVRREVYERLGSFYGVTYGEDWEMWVRIARHYPVAYTPQILAEYRVHVNSISGAKVLSGQAFRDLHFVMGEIQQHLADDKKKETYLTSKKKWAYYGIGLAYDVWSTYRSYKVVSNLVTEVLRLYIDAQLCKDIVKLYVKMARDTFLPKADYKQSVDN